MNIALKKAESPVSHAQEIQAIQSLDADSRARIHVIAMQYQSVSAVDYDQQAHPLLLYELKSVQIRFDLSNDTALTKAIAALTDPTGW